VHYEQYLYNIVQYHIRVYIFNLKKKYWFYILLDNRYLMLIHAIVNEKKKLILKFDPKF